MSVKNPKKEAAEDVVETLRQMIGEASSDAPSLKIIERKLKRVEQKVNETEPIELAEAIAEAQARG